MVATRRRRVRAAGAALAAGALLTAGCAGADDQASPAAATDETPSPTTEAPPAPATDEGPSDETAVDEGLTGELRDRLLPASAFGEDATVVGLTLEQLGAAGSGWGGWGGGWPGPWAGDGDGDDEGGRDEWADAVTVEPEACQAALDALPSLDEDSDALTFAAQAARTPQTQTVQVLAESPEIAGLQLPVDQLVADCSAVTATGPWDWSTTVEVTRLDVPQLGERSAGVQVTVDWAGRESVSMLLGFVVDGSRGLVLAQSAAPDAAAPDPAAFSTLLTEAAEAATN